MFKPFILFLTICLYCFHSFAQEYDKEYSGILQVSESQFYNYHLLLYQSDTIITGISITDKGGPDETTSEVYGTLKNKTLFIEELQMLQTASEHPVDQFCNISFTAKISKTVSGKGIQGDFIGTYLTRDSICAEGKIILAETKVMEKIEKIVKRKIEKRIEKEIAKIQHLSHTDSISLNWKSDSIQIYLWDANISDGDKVNLSINDKLLLQDHTVYSKLYNVSYPLKKGTNTIKITALNDGDQPPNTVRFEFIDKNKRHPIITQMPTGESIEIQIIRK